MVRKSVNLTTGDYAVIDAKVSVDHNWWDTVKGNGIAKVDIGGKVLPNFMC